MRSILLLLLMLPFGIASQEISPAAEPKNDPDAVDRAVENPTLKNLPLLLEAAQNATKCFPKESTASLAIVGLGKNAVPTIVAQVKSRRGKSWTLQVDNLNLLAQIGPDAEVARPVLQEIVESPKTQRYVRHFAATALAAIREDESELIRLAVTGVDFGDVALNALEQTVAGEEAAAETLERIREQKRKNITTRNAYQSKWKTLGAIHPVDAANDHELTSLALGDDLTELPKETFKLTNLTNLDLRGNRLTVLPAEIRSLAKLTQLYLSDNPLDSDELKKLKPLKNLQFLSLTGTGVSAEAVRDLGKTLKNCVIKSDYDLDK